MTAPFWQLIVFLSFVVSQNALAQQPRVFGHIFGDAYNVALHDDPEEIENHEALAGRSGFWFRRIYLALDYRLNDSWNVLLRTEMNSAGNFTSRTRLEPAAKDAYLQWSKRFTQIRIGLAPTPTWQIVEQFWGYRPVEKSLLDLQRLGSSRDIGLNVRGRLGQSRKIGYNIMIANGNGSNSENDRSKKLFASLSYRPSESIAIEVYSDVENLPDETRRVTLQGFVGYKTATVSTGIQIFRQNNKQPASRNNALHGLSVFGSAKLTDYLKGFARFDKMFDVNPEAHNIAYLPFFNTHQSQLFILGVDYSPSDQVHFMPNIELVSYEAVNGTAPGMTVMPRITFFFTFG